MDHAFAVHKNELKPDSISCGGMGLNSKYSDYTI